MKKGYRVLASVFIIGLLVLSGGTAMAAWDANSAGNQKTVITNGANASALVSVSTDNQAVYTVGENEAIGYQGIVIFTLTGGATFSSSGLSIASTGSTFTPIDPSLVPGTTTAKFLVTSAGGLVVGEKLKFSTSASAINMSGVVSGGNVDFLITLQTSTLINLVSNASYKTASGGSPTGYPLTAASLFAPQWSLLTGTADVKSSVSPYTKFENELLSVGGATGTTTAGYLNLNNNAGSVGGNIIPAQPLNKYKLLITLTGDFTGITKVTCNAAYTGSDSSGSTTTGLAGEFLINAAKTAAYATNNSTTLNDDVSPKFYIDGTTQQAERSFTVKVESFADASNYIAGTWLGPVKYFTIARNGVFFTSNSIGQYNTIKISDKSGSVPTGGAKVLISAYDATGTKLAEAAGNADILLQNNQTIELTGTQLAARFVGTAMKYEVAVTSTSAAITNVKKTPEGFGSNVWSTNGGTL
jgi:hypothetical protein